MTLRILWCLLLLVTQPAYSAIRSEITGIEYQHGYAFLSEPKYPADFPHYDYVNPKAPKGGTFRYREMGNWDSFNPLALRGRMVVGAFFWVKEWNYLLDTLMKDALDEPATQYGLIAEGISVADDGAWVAFKLRNEARWHDGQPITVQDVAYSFEIYTTVATPTISGPLQPFSHAEIVGPQEIKFHIHEAHRGNPILPLRAGNLPIIPKHYWQDRDVTKTTIEPPLGSGPYRVGRFSVGRWIEWERVKDHWARDLPVNRGTWNFDRIRWEYFRDNQVQTEAIKGHVIDAHLEDVPRRWHSSYDTPAYRAGLLKKMTYQLAKPSGLWWPMFLNMDQRRFQDIRVREALWYMMDFEWGNRRSFGFWGHAKSFFHNSELAAVGLPSDLELKLLEPLREQIPARVFTHPYRSQPNSGTGWSRENAVKAASLLKEAGWHVVNGRLRHVETGEPFDLRFVAVSRALGRGFLSFTKRLQRLGIESTIKAPEISNWLYRMRSGDFDIGAIWFLPPNTPTMLVAQTFLSSAADEGYSLNWSNLRDPAVDTLVAAMHEATTYAEFVAACRALDRVLLWNFYWLASGSKTDEALVYWDKFDRPEHGKLGRHNIIENWWYSPEKAARVAEFMGRE